MRTLSVSRSLTQSPTNDKRVLQTYPGLFSSTRRIDGKRVPASTTVPCYNSKDPIVCSKANVRELYFCSLVERIADKRVPRSTTVTL